MRWEVLVFTLAFQFCQLKSVSGRAGFQFDKSNAQLSQNSVTALFQDDQGFLWVGTQNGLNRFDGKNVATFLAGTEQNKWISNSYISDVLKGPGGRLFVGTMGGGLNVYLPEFDRFQRCDGTNGTPRIAADFVTCLFSDQTGNLWVGTEHQGLFQVSTSMEVRNYKKNEADSSSLSCNYVTDIAQDAKGNLWIGTWGAGLNMKSPEQDGFACFKHAENDQQSLASHIVRSVHCGRSGEIWVGMHDGIQQIVASKGEYFFERPFQLKGEANIIGKHVLSILEDATNHLWIGIENDGLTVVDLKTLESTSYRVDPAVEAGLPSNSIWTLFMDRNDQVWLGTFNKGLYRVSDTQQGFQTVRRNPYNNHSLSSNNVTCFVQENESTLWVGTDGGGLNRFDLSSQKCTHYNTTNKNNRIDNDAILTAFFDTHNNLWIGTWGGGVMVKYSGSHEFKSFPLVHPKNSVQGKENVFSIIEDTEGKIWFAAFKNGLYVYDPKSKQIEAFQNDPADTNSLAANDVRVLEIDHNGTIWVGTASGGLDRLVQSPQTTSFQHFRHQVQDPTSISSNSVTCLLPMASEGLWVGTYSGLNRLDQSSGRITALLFQNEVISSLESDRAGNLWVSTLKGIFKYDPRYNEISKFSVEDGLQGQEFLINSSLQSADGRLYFGGVDGYTHFDPLKILPDTSSPAAYLTELHISNQVILPGSDPLQSKLSMLKQLRLKYDQNDFNFDFALLSMQQNARNQFAYMLENYDEQWQMAGDRTSAYYTNVPPGKYTFKVKGTNSNGVWSLHQASIGIVISPAWYDSFWAYIVYMLVALSIIGLILRTIIQRQRMRSSFEIERLQVTKMQELDAMKSQFFANISHEFRTPVTLLLGPLQMLQSNLQAQLSKQQVNAMVHNANSLLKLIDQLLELSALENGKMKLSVTRVDLGDFVNPIAHAFASLAESKHIAYQIKIHPENRPVFIDTDKVEKVLSNVLSNAFKFTPDFGKIAVSINEDNDCFAIEIEDNGPGIPAQELPYIFNRYYRVQENQQKIKGTGLGLALAKELIELHQGGIIAENRQSGGARFKIVIPKGMAHFTEEQLVDHRLTPLQPRGVEFVGTVPAHTKVIAKSNSSIRHGLPTVLIVEDNDEIRKFIVQLLEEEYNVVETINGEEGITVANEIIPDLIISDVMMPKRDGFEVCTAIKASERTRHIPILLLTAKASVESELIGFECGADYFLSKPFHPKQLLLRVKNALVGRQLSPLGPDKPLKLDIGPTNKPTVDKDQIFIRKAVLVVEKHLSESNFTVDDLAEELGMSRMQLYRKFNKLIGKSGNEFIRVIRLRRAAQLIRQNQLNISEITYEVGFNDLQYFRECFKKHFGVNPSDYVTDSNRSVESIDSSMMIF